MESVRGDPGKYQEHNQGLPATEHSNKRYYKDPSPLKPPKGPDIVCDEVSVEHVEQTMLRNR